MKFDENTSGCSLYRFFSNGLYLIVEWSTGGKGSIGFFSLTPMGTPSESYSISSASLISFSNIRELEHGA